MKKILLFIFVVILIRTVWKSDRNLFFSTGFSVVLFGSVWVADLSFERYRKTRTIFRALLDAYPNGEKFLRLYGLTDNWQSTDYPSYAYDDTLSQYFQEHFPKLVAWGRKLRSLFYLLTFLFGPTCLILYLIGSICNDFRNCRFCELFFLIEFFVLAGGWLVLITFFCIDWMFSSLLRSIRLMRKINNLQRFLYQLSLEILKHGSE